jgi:hypothetical protein
MTVKRAVAITLMVALTGASVPTFVKAAPQADGLISGKATDQAKKPYSDYSVMARDVATGQIALTVPLDSQGQFSLPNLPLSTKYLVELFNIKTNQVVCTAGPYQLSTTLISKTDVNINCGGAPAALWLAAAGAGAAAAVAVAVRSASK